MAAYAHVTGNPVPTAIGTGFTVMTKANIDDPERRASSSTRARDRTASRDRAPLAPFGGRRVAACQFQFRRPHDDRSDVAAGDDAPPSDPAAGSRELRAWLFLIVLVVFFEIWARVGLGISFLFNAYNLQSIPVFATAPLLLALGQTFVIISAGIDLSLGFVMGLASVIAAHASNYFAARARPAAVRRDAGGDPFRGRQSRSSPASSTAG